MKSSAEYKRSAIMNTLRHCQLFSGLPVPDLLAISDLTVIKSLAKGDYLFREGEPAPGFYLVQTGAINVHRLSASGKEQVIHVFRPGDSFAEAILAGDNRYPADAIALESSQVLLIKKTEFTALLHRQPELALRMLGSMSQHLRKLVNQLDDLALKDVETRLINWLLRQCPQPSVDQPCTIALTMTKRVLAAELGTISETLSRTLAKLREQQWISVKGKTITVICPRRLASRIRPSLAVGRLRHDEVR